MSKAVLISIRPEWCKLIVDGKKTVEVRKSRPKLETPFKVYIYCTAGTGKNTFNVPVSYEKISRHYVETGSMKCLNCHIGNCKVIGEFICDRIYQYSTAECIEGVDITTEEITRMSCLTHEELVRYENGEEPKDFCLYLMGLYCWHISNLVIYDKPKELSEFTGLRNTKFGLEPVSLVRPPQSWCYVEELEKWRDEDG